MIKFEDVNMFARPKGEQESLTKDWDSNLPVKLRNGSRVIGKYRGQSIVQLPDGRVFKT